MEYIACKICGTIDEYRVEMKGGQKTAYCLNCGEYIKNIPQDDFMIWFGVNKGKHISEIDKGWLKWAVEKCTLLNESHSDGA